MGYIYYFLVAAAVIQSPQRGVVSAVSLAPNPVDSGVAVKATVSGTNPCGAVHIDWGDGSADSRTFPITRLPTVQTHVYRKGGRFTVRARGMGNCDGEAGTTISVVQKEPPPEITEIAIDPVPAAANRPVAITVRGTGACSYTIDFGDGNRDERSGRLPDTLQHNYPAPGRYTVTATPTGACTGRAQRAIEVRRRAAPPASGGQVRGIAVAPVVPVGEPAAMTVEGAGYCEILIEFGDGDYYFGSVRLPFRVEHAYRAAGQYEVYAGANAPCDGSSVAPVRARRR
jgi:hypothetical protein